LPPVRDDDDDWLGGDQEPSGSFFLKVILQCALNALMDTTNNDVVYGE